MKKQNAMDAFLERYGILPAWFQKNLRIPHWTYNYIINERGFSAEEQRLFESFFHAKGKELLHFKFSKNHENDLDRLKNDFGIKLSWLGAQIGVNQAQIRIYSRRLGGFRPAEQEVLLLAVKDVARAFMNFEVPRSLKKAA